MSNTFLDSPFNNSKEAQDTYATKVNNDAIDPTAESTKFSNQDYDENIIVSEENTSCLEKAQKRIVELEKLIEEDANQYNRLLADFANYKNRVSKEIQFAINLSEKKLLLELLPIMDSLERCLASSYVTLEEFHNGTTLIQKQLVEAMRKIGVEEIAIKVGDIFDPQHSEALTTLESSDLPDGSVAVIFEKGFMLHDSLLRPAKVVVNHNCPSN